MKAILALLILCVLVPIAYLQGKFGGKADGLQEGFANGREYEREIWQRKPPPEPKVIEVKVPVPVETVKVIEVPYPVPGAMKLVPVDKVITETKVYQVRTGCVGGCRCSDTEDGK